MNSFKKIITWVALLCSFVIFFENLNSEVAIQIDRGSFALRPPEHEGPEVNAVAKTKNPFVNQRVQRPIPTNDWWSYLIKDRFSGDLWAYPLDGQLQREWSQGLST